MAGTLTPMEAFLAPLAKLAAQDPEIEGHVFWATGDQWPDAPAEALEAEEIVFYAEGLLQDGFRLIWQIIGTSEDGPETILLYFWQGGTGQTPAPPPDFGPVLHSEEWTP